MIITNNTLTGGCGGAAQYGQTKSLMFDQSCIRSELDQCMAMCLRPVRVPFDSASRSTVVLLPGEKLSLPEYKALVAAVSGNGTTWWREIYKYSLNVDTLRYTYAVVFYVEDVYAASPVLTYTVTLVPDGTQLNIDWNNVQNDPLGLGLYNSWLDAELDWSDFKPERVNNLLVLPPLSLSGTLQLSADDQGVISGGSSFSPANDDFGYSMQYDFSYEPGGSLQFSISSASLSGMFYSPAVSFTEDSISDHLTEGRLDGEKAGRLVTITAERYKRIKSMMMISNDYACSAELLNQGALEQTVEVLFTS